LHPVSLPWDVRSDVQSTVTPPVEQRGGALARHWELLLRALLSFRPEVATEQPGRQELCAKLPVQATLASALPPQVPAPELMAEPGGQSSLSPPPFSPLPPLPLPLPGPGNVSAPAPRARCRWSLSVSSFP